MELIMTMFGFKPILLAKIDPPWMPPESALSIIIKQLAIQNNGVRKG